MAKPSKQNFMTMVRKFADGFVELEDNRGRKVRSKLHTCVECERELEPVSS